MDSSLSAVDRGRVYDSWLDLAHAKGGTSTKLKWHVARFFTNHLYDGTFLLRLERSNPGVTHKLNVILTNVTFELRVDADRRMVFIEAVSPHPSQAKFTSGPDAR